MNLILDIDNTLLSAESTDEFDFDDEKDKSSKFKFHDMDGYYIIFERPHVQEFLDYAFKNFNVSIWTAASKDYAVYIIKNVIIAGHPERKNNIDYVFYSYHCDLSVNKMTGTKDLNMLWNAYKLDGYTNQNTLIMDDYDEVKNTNPNNCILVDAFNYFDTDSHNDTYLMDIIPVLDKLEQGEGFLKNIDSTYVYPDNMSVDIQHTLRNENTVPTLMEIDIINTKDNDMISQGSVKSEQSIYEEIFNEDTNTNNTDVKSVVSAGTGVDSDISSVVIEYDDIIENGDDSDSDISSVVIDYDDSIENGDDSDNYSDNYSDSDN